MSEDFIKMDEKLFRKLGRKIIVAIVVQTFAYIIVFGGIALNDHFRLKSVERAVSTKMDYESYSNLSKLMEEKHDLTEKALDEEKKKNLTQYNQLQGQIADINRRIDQLFRNYNYSRGAKR